MAVRAEVNKKMQAQRKTAESPATAI